MFYYKHKEKDFYLAFKNVLTVDNYPDYSQNEIDDYEQISKDAFNIYQQELHKEEETNERNLD